MDLILSNWPAKIHGLSSLYTDYLDAINKVYYDIQAANSRGTDQNADASDDFGILQIFFERISHEDAHLAVAEFQTALNHNKEAIAASSIIKLFQN